jgi:hypothetical protein
VNAGGEKSKPEKRETPEGAESVVPQDPRDKAKAELPEAQSLASISTEPPSVNNSSTVRDVLFEISRITLFVLVSQPWH